MRALITGSVGFIGSSLAATLEARGDGVIGVDRRAARRPGHHLLDLADRTTLADLAALGSQVDVVFHLAARPGVRDQGAAAALRRRRDNVDATRNLLEAIPLGVPMVVASSSSVYGGSGSGIGEPRPSHEEDPIRPLGGYARSKVAMEALCERRRDRGGTVAVVRPFTVAGEGQRPDMAFSIWWSALRAGRPIRILGSPERTRDVTDIRHVVEGLVRAADRGFDGTVNLGTGVGHRLVDMASAVLEATGVPGEIVVDPATPDEVTATLADTARCAAELGFVPHTDLRALVARQVAAAGTRPSASVGVGRR
jgi:nucleoside-diphosphate-sugar epimerase